MKRLTTLNKLFWLNKGYSEEESILKSKEISPFSKFYWMNKGLTENESIEKVKEIQTKNSIKSNQKEKNKIKIYQTEYWMNLGLSENESLEKIKTIKRENSSRCKEYWIKKGFSEDESIKKVSEVQRNCSKKQKKGKKINQYSKEYWINKGIINETEINEKIKEAKIKSNPYIILDDIKKNKMMENRKITYYSKSEEDIIKINKSRGLDKEKFIEKFGIESYNNKIKDASIRFKKEYYIEKFGEEKYKKWRENQLKSICNRKFIKVSKISKELFDNIIDEEIKNECFYGTNEKALTFYEEKLYIFYADFLYKNKIIEFYGDYFHGNPKLYEDDCVIGSRHKRFTVKEKNEMDKKRETILTKNGYNVLVVWENDYKNNKKEIIETCKKWIKNL